MKKSDFGINPIREKQFILHALTAWFQMYERGVPKNDISLCTKGAQIRRRAPSISTVTRLPHEHAHHFLWIDASRKKLAPFLYDHILSWERLKMKTLMQEAGISKGSAACMGSDRATENWHIIAKYEKLRCLFRQKKLLQMHKLYQENIGEAPIYEMGWGKVRLLIILEKLLNILQYYAFNRSYRCWKALLLAWTM